jgi:hypothetical protein
MVVIMVVVALFINGATTISINYIDGSLAENPIAQKIGLKAGANVKIHLDSFVSEAILRLGVTSSKEDAQSVQIFSTSLVDVSEKLGGWKPGDNLHVWVGDEYKVFKTLAVANAPRISVDGDGVKWEWDPVNNASHYTLITYTKSGKLLIGIGGASAGKTSYRKEVDSPSEYLEGISWVQSTAGRQLVIGKGSFATSVDEFQPENYELYNYPNPFNPTTTIRYSLNHSDHVQLIIYNQNGQVIQTLVDEVHSTGNHQIVWTAGNQPSGVYYYQLRVGEQARSRKAILQK